MRSPKIISSAQQHEAYIQRLLELQQKAHRTGPTIWGGREYCVPRPERKWQLNIQQIKKLSQRFHVSPAVFF